MAAHAATGSVTGGAECESHALVRAGEDIGSGTHRSTDQNRLTDCSQGLWYGFVPGSKGARGALAVDEEPHLFSVHGMLFNFAGVVRYVVKQRQLGLGKYLYESFPHPGGADL